MSDVVVVVAARDAEATIGRTLAALAAQEGDLRYEVIVVDSGSRDATAAIARAAPVVDLVLENPGGEPAGSRNLGVAASRAPTLAFTDADCEPAPDWLAAGVRALEQAEIVQGRVEPWEATGPYDRTLWVPSEYGLYETANLFVRRETFEGVGGFEAVLDRAHRPRPFGEDVWFVWRAKRAGARTAFAPRALVRHAVFPRGPGGFVAERARCRYFPPLVAMVPELRGAFLHRRWFLSSDSRRFDMAVAGLVAGLAVGRSRPRSALALGAASAVPYLRSVYRATCDTRERERIARSAVRLAADAVTASALLYGSLSSRTIVL